MEHLYTISDDMEIAPDFFDYFEAMATLLDKDKYVFMKRVAELFSSDSLYFFLKNTFRSLLII
jgi:hypothetical protein